MRLTKILKGLLLITLAFTGFVFLGCSTQPPKVTTFVELSRIGDDEVKKFDQAINSAGIPKERLRMLVVKVNIDNSKSLKEREIAIPNLEKIIDHFDKVRSLTGGDYYQNNIGVEDWAESSRFVIFDYQGLNDDTLKQMFNDSFILVSWTTEKGQQVEQKYSIGELLKFN